MYIKEKINVETEKIVGVSCDQCGIKVEASDIPDDWYLFSSSHNSWGNDSFESNKQHDVCSPKCFSLKLELLMLELWDEHDAEIADMKLPFVKKLLTYMKRQT